MNLLRDADGTNPHRPFPGIVGPLGPVLIFVAGALAVPAIVSAWSLAAGAKLAAWARASLVPLAALVVLPPVAAFCGASALVRRMRRKGPPSPTTSAAPSEERT